MVRPGNNHFVENHYVKNNKVDKKLSDCFVERYLWHFGVLTITYYLWPRLGKVR